MYQQTYYLAVLQVLGASPSDITVCPGPGQELHQVLSLGFGDVLYTESKVVLKLGLGPPGWELLFQGHPTVV